MSLPLAFAQRCADRLVTWLRPFSDRIEIAGSIRRERPSVGDIDLVAIPKVHEEFDLLGGLERTDNLMALEIQRRCLDEGWRVVRDGENFIQFLAPSGQGKEPIQVDIWFAVPETFGTVWLCRTGSKEHNIRLTQRAQALGGHWNPHKGVQIGPRWFAAATEQDVFAALQLAFIPPTQREL